mgnify:CR=1 FL=1
MSHKITVVGLGAGDIGQLPLGVYKQLTGGQTIFLRTKEHPAVMELEREGMVYTAFDDVYEQHGRFEEVYEEIAAILFREAEQQDILYAVPGHPLVAERTVQLLLEQGPAKQTEVKIGGGQSFIDALFTAVKVDPIEGFQLLDGTDLKRKDIRTGRHLIIGQVYDAFIASDVKLTLMEKYPDEHTVAVVRAAGSRDEKVTWLPLYELDRQFELDNLTSVYVPPLQGRDLKDFSELRQIIADLRGPEGCPWDKEQTHLSLKKYLIEECYEVLEAIDEEDEDHLVEELGDVLLQVMLHAQIGEDEGMFAIEDVMEALASKMIRRHPHVFGDAEVTDAEEVTKNWERIKAAEKPGTGRESLLNGVAKGMPALIRAYEIQKKAAKVGFDWEHAAEALEKVREELREFAAEIESGQRENEIAEFGDLLFAMINVARFLRIHPEEALEQTNQKFIRRFHFIEQQVKKSGRDFSDFSLEELNAFWNLAKKEERK